MTSQLEQFYIDRFNLNRALNVLKNLGIDYRLSFKYGGYNLCVNSKLYLSDYHVSPGELVKLIDCFLQGYLYKSLELRNQRNL